jgi:hypothetical protein
MKRIVFLSLLLFLFNIHAAFAENGSTGNFDIIGTNGIVSVYYSIAPAYPDNVALQMRPNGEFNLNAHIVNANGEEVMKLKEETVTARYANSIDISALSAGDYYIELFYGENNEHSYRIPFSKQ